LTLSAPLTYQQFFITPSLNGLQGAMTAVASPTGTRLAILSTPRAGNTWVRRVLAKCIAAPDMAVHWPGDVDWKALPSSCILQLHWHRTARFVDLLTRHQFRIVVLIRHPLDVLISILHFALQDRSTLQWLDSEGGSERAIRGATPCSRAFLQYATSARATALLSISHEWSAQRGAWPLRYEAMVADPIREVLRLTEGLGLPIAQSVEAAVADSTLARLRQQTQCTHHFWQGRPGLWRSLLTADVAGRIARCHERCLVRLGYNVWPDDKLDRARAEENWLALIRPELSLRLWGFVRTRQVLETQAVGDDSLLAEAKPVSAIVGDQVQRALRRFMRAGK
jgi:hypothetical protein